jgi:hypothetical protein
MVAYALWCGLIIFCILNGRSFLVLLLPHLAESMQESATPKFIFTSLLTLHVLRFVYFGKESLTWIYLFSPVRLKIRDRFLDEEQLTQNLIWSLHHASPFCCEFIHYYRKRSDKSSWFRGAAYEMQRTATVSCSHCRGIVCSSLIRNSCEVCSIHCFLATGWLLYGKKKPWL